MPRGTPNCHLSGNTQTRPRWFIRQVADGRIPGTSDTPVLDTARTVQTDVCTVLWAEEIPQNVDASGHVYDIDTGLVTTVVDAKGRK